MVQREQLRRERDALQDRLASCQDDKEELHRALEQIKKSTSTKLQVCTTNERALQGEMAELKNELASLQREQDKLQRVRQAA